jgi:hypothetical protein
MCLCDGRPREPFDRTHAVQRRTATTFGPSPAKESRAYDQEGGGDVTSLIDRIVDRGYDWRGNLPSIARRAAVRTALLGAVALALMLIAGTAMAAGDPGP